MATIDHLIRSADMRKKAAERAVSDRKNDLRRFMDSLKEAGIADHEMDDKRKRASA